jgi:hypothetical protein
MGILGPVAATQCLNQPDNLAALLETSLHQRHIDQVGKQWAAGDEQVPTGHKNSQRLVGKALEERT